MPPGGFPGPGAVCKCHFRAWCGLVRSGAVFIRTRREVKCDRNTVDCLFSGRCVFSIDAIRWRSFEHPEVIDNQTKCDLKKLSYTYFSELKLIKLR